MTSVERNLRKAAQARARYKANPAVFRERHKRWYHANKTKILTNLALKYKELKKEALVLFGSKCSWCGIEDIRVLELDHINGDGWKDRRDGMNHGRLWLSLVKNGVPPGKYQLLCANCHTIKTWHSKEHDVVTD